MTTKEVLLEQFTKCYDENGWFVAVRRTIDGVSAEQAAWKPEVGEHSIWDSLSHLIFYNQAYLERFKGVDYKYETDDNDETFTDGGTEQEWNDAVEKFDAVMNDWLELIKAADEAKFATQVSQENKASWATLIANVNAHNAYHAGQILLLRRLQGSWNPEEGVS